MTDTQIKLIEAAEREFAERGFHGASIRHITNRAGANVAAVNYHFGSKEKLFVEMIRFRVEPINKYRLELLESVLQKNGGKPLPLRKIVEIIVQPLIDKYLKDENQPNMHFLRALGRGMSEESEFMNKLQKDVFSKVIQRFQIELQRTFSDLPPQFVASCFAFLGSTLSGFMQYQMRNQISADKACRFPLTEYLVIYIVGGIQAIVDEYRSSPHEAPPQTHSLR